MKKLSQIKVCRAIAINPEVLFGETIFNDLCACSFYEEGMVKSKLSHHASDFSPVIMLVKRSFCKQGIKLTKSVTTI